MYTQGDTDAAGVGSAIWLLLHGTLLVNISQFRVANLTFVLISDLGSFLGWLADVRLGRYKIIIMYGH